MSIKDKIKFGKKSKATAITQKNIEKSREEILANGKKFRYPFQYAKHRLVINTILIALVALLVSVGMGYLQLYVFQSTSEVAYRFTSALRLPVGKIDGKTVRYSDYLLLYRSSISSIEYQSGKFDDSEDAQSQLRHYKRQAMTEAEDYSYALGKLKELNLTVTEAEIDALIDEHKSINGEKRSDEVFEQIVQNNFGLSMKDYRRLILLTLAKRKVAEAVDTDAKKLLEEVKTKLKTNGGKMEELEAEYSKNEIFNYEKTTTAVNVNNLDSGRAEKANSLAKEGDISEPFVSKNGDGYYIVKLISKGEGKVNYESIWVRFAKLNSDLEKVRADNKYTEYIQLDGDVDATSGAEDAEAEEPVAPASE